MTTWHRNLIVLLLAASLVGCDEVGELFMRGSAGKRKDIGQIKTLDKLVHEFEVDLSQKPYGWVLWIDGRGQITNSSVALSFTDLGTNDLSIQFTSGTELSSSYILQPGQTQEVFKGSFGSLYSFIFTRTAGRLHYKVSLSFAHSEPLSEPIQVYAEQWTPSL
jgi:hypothetical protein